MYTQYYGLRRAPFELTPDPAFFSPTPRHNEALASLWYGVQQRRGLIMVTGEVGTGKTMLLRYLLMALPRDKVQFSYIFNPRLEAAEFLQYLAADFGVVAPGKSKVELLWNLNRWLLANHKDGMTPVVVIDEAHLLEWDVLEEIRLLTNLETTQHKLVQIVLAGQPELEEKLNLPELRQLRQRIAFRAKLLPFTEAQTCTYIRERLRKAGAEAVASIFPDSSCGAVYRHSHGIPRVINNLCENALICGFARQMRMITAEVVDEVAEDYGLGREYSSNPVGGDDCRAFGTEVSASDGSHPHYGLAGPFTNLRRKA